VLRKNKLWEAVAKLSRIHCLWHVIFGEGIVMDPMKVEAILEWHMSMNVPEVRSFIVLAGYYRLFVEGSSKIENSIMELEKKKKKFFWTQKCTKSFRRIKELFKTTQILKVPGMDEGFLVCTDTSKEGLDRVLMQDGRVVSFISRKLRKHEENYVMHDLELLAIMYALRVWRHYLIGQNFKLKTNQCGLQHLFMQNDLSMWQGSWSEMLIRYDFEISYLK
jgi:hypothetical protein